MYRIIPSTNSTPRELSLLTHRGPKCGFKGRQAESWGTLLPFSEAHTGFISSFAYKIYKYVRACVWYQSHSCLSSQHNDCYYRSIRRPGRRRPGSANSFRNIHKADDRRCLTEAKLTEARLTEASSGISCARFRALMRPIRLQDSLRHKRLRSCFTEARARAIMPQ